MAAKLAERDKAWRAEIEKAFTEGAEWSADLPSMADAAAGFDDHDYRIAPTELHFDLDAWAARFKWLALDYNYAWHLYFTHPIRQRLYWHSNESHTYVKNHFVTNFTGPWDKSLHEYRDGKWVLVEGQ